MTEGSAPALSTAAARVQAALHAAGLAVRVVEMPASTRTAREAAAAIGCDVAQIAKTVVFRAREEPVLVVASGRDRIDEAGLADHLGAPAVPADAALVRSATGFAIGGVPPLGHARSLRTLVERSLLAFDVVWAAAGTPHAVFAIAPTALVAATAAEVVTLAQRPAER